MTLICLLCLQKFTIIVQWMYMYNDCTFTFIHVCMYMCICLGAHVPPCAGVDYGPKV